jgi:hypothetical protein
MLTLLFSESRRGSSVAVQALRLFSKLIPARRISIERMLGHSSGLSDYLCDCLPVRSQQDL